MDHREESGATTAAGGTSAYDVEQAVRTRYGAGARRPEPALCCPTSYDSHHVDLLPAEIRERDYGCGDPTVYVGPGESVVDLGCGGGKICYILAQKVGAEGRAIGVDFSDEMLALARRYELEMGEKLGYHNVSFRKGRIQDLALDLEKAEAWLGEHPVTDIESLGRFEKECDRLRREQPLIPDGSVDVVVSNCVLNLVRPQDKQQLFAEIFRILGNGGRAVISDIVCDEDPTDAIRSDPELWSGCIAGAFREDLFLKMFEDAGFYGVQVLKCQADPWRTIDGIEFRSLTVRAYKGKQGPCLERNQAVIYGGPWKQVKDDDGHTFSRGQRIAVCDKTFNLLTDPRGPYAGQLSGVEPLAAVPVDEAALFNCKGSGLRHARDTKGGRITTEDPGACCGPEDCC